MLIMKVLIFEKIEYPIRL